MVKIWKPYPEKILHFVTRCFHDIEQDLCLLVEGWRTSILFFAPENLRFYQLIVTNGNQKYMLENCSTKLTELVISSLALCQLFHGKLLSDVYEPKKGLEHAESGLFAFPLSFCLLPCLTTLLVQVLHSFRC